jgi:hypothetical protein
VGAGRWSCSSRLAGRGGGRGRRLTHARAWSCVCPVGAGLELRQVVEIAHRTASAHLHPQVAEPVRCSSDQEQAVGGGVVHTRASGPARCVGRRAYRGPLLQWASTGYR